MNWENRFHTKWRVKWLRLSLASCVIVAVCLAVALVSMAKGFDWQGVLALLFAQAFALIAGESWGEHAQHAAWLELKERSADE